MVGGETQGLARQSSGPRGVAVGNGGGVELGALGGGGAQQDDEVVGAYLVDDPFDIFLTLQVKSAGGGSNETVGHLQDYFRSGAAGAVGDGGPLDPVPFSQSDYSHTLELHRFRPPRSTPILTFPHKGGRDLFPPLRKVGQSNGGLPLFTWICL